MAQTWVEPFAAALALRGEPGLVLLESMPGFGHLGRRSFLAARPERVVTDGMPALDGAGAAWHAGWLSYDLGRELEALPTIAQDDMCLPPLALGRYGAWIEWDHRERLVTLHGQGERRHLERSLARAAHAKTPSHRPLASWSSGLTRADYIRATDRVIDYIRAGDAFQVNLAQRLETPWAGDPFALYGRLRKANPAPFMALVRLGGADVVSASPELFLRRSGSLLETRPIKGTRPRGRSRREDRALAAELRESAKDRAENVMIADLARNDLGRVARFGTVRPRRLCALERHPGVHHLVSVVECRLRGDARSGDIVRATFPPGSVTGAPKIRAMEIIEELEPVRRGVYCGSVGWLRPQGDLALSVAIRTFVAVRGLLTLHVGGAIVADSEPELEWRETMHKASRLLAAAGGELHTGAGGPRAHRQSARPPALAR